MLLLAVKQCRWIRSGALDLDLTATDVCKRGGGGARRPTAAAGGERWWSSPAGPKLGFPASVSHADCVYAKHLSLRS
jgi:hypothetical protein